MTTIGVVLSWLGLSAMLVMVAFQLHTLVLVGGYWLIQSPTLRPPGWSNTTLSGVSSLAYLVLGGATLIVATLLEQSLSRAASENRLLRLAGKSFLIIGSVWLILAGLQLLAM